MDCYLPADFFLADDLRRRDDIDPTLGADAHVHFESPAFVTGLRDWHQPRHSRGSGHPATSTSTSRKPTSLGPRLRADDELARLLRARIPNAAARVARRPGQRPAVRRVVATLLALLAGCLALDAGWLHAKAWLAQDLLADAWQRSQASGMPHKPWPWADTHPVARLRVPGHGVDQIVLAGDSGRTLAFGPGWAESSAHPGAQGTPVISGHRDTHFAFLRRLAPGDEIALQGARGESTYRVASTRIADARTETLAPGDDDALLLVTCWPFDAVVSGGPLRYVVRAERL